MQYRNRKLNKMAFARMLLVLLFLAISVTADTAIQTDWSGGGGVLGPVTDFGSSFWYCNCIDWFNDIGQLTRGYSNGSIADSLYPITNGPIVVGDINGDGAEDAVCCCYDDTDYYSVYWFENNGSMNEIWPAHIVFASLAGALTCSDIDNDGDIDIAAISSSGFLWFENDDGVGGSWVTRVLPDQPQGSEYGTVSIADIDGDDNVDYIVSYILDNIGYIDWWKSNGPQSPELFTTRDAIADFSETVREISPADIDDDGDIDLAASIKWMTFPYAWYSRILWLENSNGSGTQWIERTIRNDRYLQADILTCDFEEDGSIDVLEGNNASGTYIHRNTDGTGLIWEETHVWDYNVNNGFGVADVDLDGDNDIIQAYLRNLDWFENTDGQGYEWTSHSILRDLEDYINAFTLFDYDNDLYQDFLIAGWYGNADFEEITLFELSFEESFLESSVLDAGDTAAWGTFGWLATVPDSTLVGFQVRASASPDVQGPWSDTLFQPVDLTEVIGDGDRYFQYRTLLESNDPQVTPVLEEVSLEWNELSIADDPAKTDLLLQRIYPNPASGAVTISYNLVHEGALRLLIYDVTGRLAFNLDLEVQEPGDHALVLSDLVPGMYFCRLETDACMETDRFVLLP